MITIRKGSQVQKLICVLAVTGEFPVRSIHLLGNKRTLKRLLLKLSESQEYRMENSDTRHRCRLIKMSGKGELKTIRFYKSALQLLEELDSDLYQYYMHTFYQHHFPGGASHIERNHRVAESILMCMNAGIEARPLLLPKLQNQSVRNLILDGPSFYQGKDLKKIRETELNKTMFSRITGAIILQDNCYVVYNTRGTLMKWNGMGEFKTLHSVMEAARMNAGIRDIHSAILFGFDETVAIRTMEESERNKRLEFRFDGIYHHIHFIPMNEFGIRLLKILTTPDWNQILLDLLFEPEDRSYNKGHFEYDAKVNGIYVYSHLDGDIARLIRFKEGLQTQKIEYEVLCFIDQMPLLREYLGEHASLKIIDMDVVELELCPDRRKLFE